MPSPTSGLPDRTRPLPLRYLLAWALCALVSCAQPSVSAPGEGNAGVSARHLPADQLIEHLVSVARSEWLNWGETVVDVRSGDSVLITLGATERDRAWRAPATVCSAGASARAAPGCSAAGFDARDRVRQYWRDGLGSEHPLVEDPLRLEWVTDRSAWSAVFISWLMQRVGLGRNAFPFDEAHAGYLRGLAVRSHNSEGPQFAILLSAEHPLARGDLLCAPRNASRDPAWLSLQVMRELHDLQTLRGAHCDLVVKVDRTRREAHLIGGNVEDAVALTRMPLTADGRAIRILSRPWFVLARPTDPSSSLTAKSP